MAKTSSAAVDALLLALCLGPTMAAADISAVEVEPAKTVLKDSIAIPTVEGRGRGPEMAAYCADKRTF